MSTAEILYLVSIGASLLTLGLTVGYLVGWRDAEKLYRQQ
jgi:hypothetical protein